MDSLTNVAYLQIFLCAHVLMTFQDKEKFLQIFPLLVTELQQIFRRDVRKWSNYLFGTWILNYSSTFIQQTILSPLLYNAIFFINQVPVYAQLCFKTLFCSIKLILNMILRKLLNHKPWSS